ncbi:hypothetical protein B0H10DRAFT_2242907 [Mycena sp. CBHHK59/15]|nr:hypothetical protein B0H10DRAFT_2242907 [Mycena sp. CBHHK59/15]
MSFVEDVDGNLGCELWPEEYCVSGALNVPVDTSTMAVNAILPHHYADLDMFMYVGRNPTTREASRNQDIFYCYVPVAATGTLCIVTLRLQGFVEACNLRALGNWGGSSYDAAGAIQFIRICGDGSPAWAVQLHAIDNIRALIQSSGDAELAPMTDTLELRMSRRVFTKIMESNSTAVNTVHAGDDPDRWLNGVHANWRITSTLTAGVLAPTEDVLGTELRRCSANITGRDTEGDRQIGPEARANPEGETGRFSGSADY